jgi:hypothetical protein
VLESVIEMVSVVDDEEVGGVSMVGTDSFINNYNILIDFRPYLMTNKRTFRTSGSRKTDGHWCLYSC